MPTFGALETSPSRADPAAAPNYTVDEPANSDASALGSQLSATLQTSSEFATIQIVSSGLLIGLTADDESLEQQVRTDAGDIDPSIPISFELRPYSNSQLMGVEAQLADNEEQLKSNGVDLSMWTPNTTDDRLQVYLAPDSSQEAAALLEGTYGPIIEVASNNFSLGAGDANRANDYEPWSGADQLVVGGEEPTTCTAWFSTFDDTQNYNATLTAGHCGAGTWYNHFLGNPNYFRGLVTNAGVHWTDGGTADVERGNNTGSQVAIVWSKDENYRTVHAVEDNFAISGTAVCIDGQTTLEYCNRTVIQNDSVDANYGGKTIHGQYEILSESGSSACDEGDSGGPVYTTPANVAEDGGNVTALGMLVAGSPDGTYCVATPVKYVLGAFLDKMHILTA